MNKLKLLFFISIMSTASIAQQSDSTKNHIAPSNHTPIITISSKTEQKNFNKQASVSKKTTTTWTKIKDLFM